MNPWGENQTNSNPSNSNRKNAQNFFRGDMPSNLSPKALIRGVMLAAVIGLGIWLASGFYRVDSDEKGIVLRFGKIVKTADPGLNYHLPWPIETALLPKVTKVNRIDVGFRDVSGKSGNVQSVPEESLVLTGDENIVDINFSVFWIIGDAAQYLFNVENPNQNVKAIAESVMREVVGKEEIQSVLTSERKRVEQEIQEGLQSTLNDYGAGIQVTEVKLQKVDPPTAVIDSFRDVQAAEADKERSRNEAEAYANTVIPAARGKARQLIEGAQAYKESIVANARGKSQRYLMILQEYKNAPDTLEDRLRLEILEDLLRKNDVLVVPDGEGVNFYSPLNDFIPQRGQKRGSDDTAE